MDVTVRLLTIDDLDLLLSTPPGVFDDPIIEPSARRFLENGDNFLIAAQDNAQGGQIIGFASAHKLAHPDKLKPDLYINEVGVAEAWRRQGVGRRLMDAVLDVARREGCKTVWLQTEPDNAPAIALYRSSGAKGPEKTVNFDFDL